MLANYSLSIANHQISSIQWVGHFLALATWKTTYAKLKGKRRQDILENCSGWLSKSMRGMSRGGAD
jgi:hypothetical protein